ncbi:hypothetical protein ACFQGT_02480 [Natrialbaceae archaeon GCM10025810]|uniref:hypothetical protein n=1 Tax=Halovalidus salilacus TaxID=3075124 RepID=UPI003620056C
MRISIPGFPGVYYDTDAESTATAIAFTAAGRRAPKPHGYALQVVPYLWSFDVDLREVPTDHPIQYLHPEGAQSLGTVVRNPNARQVGNDLEALVRFVWAVNEELESATGRLIGTESGDDREGVVIEIEDGNVGVSGRELETDEFDFEETEGEADEGSDAESDADVPDGSEDVDIEEFEPAADEFEIEGRGRDVDEVDDEGLEG